MFRRVDFSPLKWTCSISRGINSTAGFAIYPQGCNIQYLNVRAGEYSCVVKRQGINSLAHRESPLKRTKCLGAWILVHLSGLVLLAVELIPRRGSLSTENLARYKIPV
jgi:hypothetical protein